MRVLFVYPNIDCPPGINHGIAARSGVLKSRGHAVGLIHVCDNLWELPTTEQVLDRIDAFKPDIVGFSVMSQQYPWTKGVSKALRARRPDLPQAIGGVHCTMVPEEVTADDLFEWVFVGECDDAFPDLVDRILSELDRVGPAAREAASLGALTTRSAWCSSSSPSASSSASSPRTCSTW